MPRPRLFTDKQFRSAYKSARDMLHLATTLGVTTQAVYNHCRRLGLQSLSGRSTRETKTRAVKLMDSYRGRTSILSLGQRFNMHPSKVRYHLESFITDMEFDPTLPPPKNLTELKLYFALREEPELFDDPEELAGHTALPPTKVGDYLQRVFRHRTRRTKVKSRSRALSS